MIIDIVEEKIPRSVRKSVYNLLANMYKLESPDGFVFANYKDFKSFIDNDIENNCHILLYFKDSKAVGCLYANVYRYANETFYEEGCMCLSNLYVSPDYRGQGIATKLISYAEELAIEEGVKHVASSYKEGNKESEGVHKKNNFKVLERHTVVIKEI